MDGEETESSHDGGFVPKGGSLSNDISTAYRKLSPALVDYESCTDHLQSCLADCHLFVDSVRSDASSAHTLLPQIRANFAHLETLFASVDRLEALVSTATTNVDMLEHEMNLAEQDLANALISGNEIDYNRSSTIAAGSPIAHSSPSSNNQQRIKQNITSAGIAIKRFFKPKTLSSSPKERGAAGSTSSGGAYMAPPQVFFTSDFFPPKPSPGSKQQ